MDKGIGILGSADITKEDIRETYSNIRQIHKSLLDEMRLAVVGQDDIIEQILIAILTKNHALLEGYPGLGKTLMINTLSRILDLDFKRIQCTPDVMPSDITGTYIVESDDSGKKVFRFEKGPVFTNILLTDEINRATPKTQSALLEAMQEKQVTLGTSTHNLENPFFVLATQNPIEMEGTYPLPEAQLDRFLLKILIGYPTEEDESRIIDLYTSKHEIEIKKVLGRKQLIILQELTREMPIADDVKKHALRIVTKTRSGEIYDKYLDYGASPRASIGIILAAKARALLRGRNYVSREDIEAMAYPVLRHRIIPNFESERKGVSRDEVIKEVIKSV